MENRNGATFIEMENNIQFTRTRAGLPATNLAGLWGEVDPFWSDATSEVVKFPHGAAQVDRRDVAKRVEGMSTIRSECDVPIR